MWPFNKRKKWEKLGIACDMGKVWDCVQLLNPDYLFLRDRDYRCIPNDEFETILFDCWFPNQEPAYKSDIFDCDDFAVCCMAEVKKQWARISKGKEALAFGYMEADVKEIGFHAFIWQLDHTGVVRFYEPQSGKRVNYEFNSVRLIET